MENKDLQESQSNNQGNARTVAAGELVGTVIASACLAAIGAAGVQILGWTDSIFGAWCVLVYAQVFLGGMLWK